MISDNVGWPWNATRGGELDAEEGIETRRLDRGASRAHREKQGNRLWLKEVHAHTSRAARMRSPHLVGASAICLVKRKKPRVDGLCSRQKLAEC